MQNNENNNSSESINYAKSNYQKIIIGNLSNGVFGLSAYPREQYSMPSNCGTGTGSGSGSGSGTGSGSGSGTGTGSGTGSGEIA